MEEFFKGLNSEDAKLAAEDLMYFGTAFVWEVDGEKRRIAPNNVMLNGTSATIPNGDRGGAA